MYGGGTRSDVGSNTNGATSHAAGGYNNNNSQQDQQHQRNANEPRNLSTDVEVQKAVLSTHFTEIQPGPENAKNGNSAPSGYQPQDPRLNAVAGPGQEYLPPAANHRKEPDLQRNSQNGGSSPSFPSGNNFHSHFHRLPATLFLVSHFFTHLCCEFFNSWPYLRR